jgi:hypothetical protein
MRTISTATDESYRLQYQLTKADSDELVRMWLRSRWPATLVGFVAALFVGERAYSATLAPWKLNAGIIAALVIVVCWMLALLIGHYLWRWRTWRYMKAARGTEMLTVEVSPSGIEWLAADGSKSFNTWQSVSGLQNTPHMLLVLFPGDIKAPIPRRAFASGDEADGFFRAMESLRAVALAGSPVAHVPPSDPGQA